MKIDFYYVIYHSLIFAALLLSYVAYKKGIKKAYFLIWILLATFLVESLVGVLKFIFHKKGFGWIYHVFNPIEYTTFCIYYLKNCSVEKFKPFVAWSIPVFIVSSIGVSCFLYHFESFPAINIDAECFLLFIIYAHLLFSLNVNLDMYIYTHPDFWIATGVLAFFGGISVYFGLYHTLLHIDYIHALILFGIITKPLNVILYGCIIIGIICLMQNRKYFTPQGL